MLLQYVTFALNYPPVFYCTASASLAVHPSPIRLAASREHEHWWVVMLSTTSRYCSIIRRAALRADVSVVLFRRGRFLSSTTASPTEFSRNLAEQRGKKESKETVKLDLCGDIEGMGFGYLRGASTSRRTFSSQFRFVGDNYDVWKYWRRPGS